MEKLKETITIFDRVFVQNYGRNESVMTVCFFSKNDHVFEGNPKMMAQLASAGCPYSWVEVKIVDETGREVAPGETGELIVRSEHHMTRYLNRPEETDETTKNGWICTGDIAKVDDEGHIFLVLYRHPEVVKASPFAMPDEK